MRACVDSLRVGAIAGVVLASLGLGACSGDATQTSSVEIIDWWKQGGEAEAIGALLAEFKRQEPHVKVIDSSVDGSSLARAAIRNRMTQGTPPDTFQANGGWDLMAWVLYNGTSADQTKMQALEPATLDWFDKVPDSVKASVSYKGKVYAVPLNIHRLNVVFYNRQIFGDLDIDPTQLNTLDDMFAAADKVVQHNQQIAGDPTAKPITPIALGYRATEGDMATDDSWTLSLLFFENIIVARMGGTNYQNLFFKPQLGDAFTPAMTNALADFRRLVVSYSNPNASSLTWNQPLDMVLNGQAAMTIMGDWGKGYANAAGKGDTFGVIPTPGTAGTFVFTTDTFGIPIGALDVDNAKRLLDVFGSREGQDIFNPIKGSISARNDSLIDDPTYNYDAMAKQTFADFNDPNTLIVQATSILAPQTFIDAMSAALAELAKARDNGNPSIVQHTMDDYGDILRSSCWPSCQPPPQQ